MIGLLEWRQITARDPAGRSCQGILAAVAAPLDPLRRVEVLDPLPTAAASGPLSGRMSLFITVFLVIPPCGGRHPLADNGLVTYKFDTGGKRQIK